MASKVLTNAKLYHDGVDLSGDTNQISVDYSVDMVDVTTFGNTTRVKAAGLKQTAINAEVFVDSDGTTDAEIFPQIGASSSGVVTVYHTEASGEIGYTAAHVGATFTPGGKVGEAYKASYEAQGTGNLYRITCLETGQKSATGNGAGRRVAGINTGVTGIAVLHVHASSGTSPTIDVVVQSDDNEEFSDPTARATFTQATTTGAEIKTISGAITDQFWRAIWTIGGSDTPTMTITVGLATE